MEKLTIATKRLFHQLKAQKLELCKQKYKFLNQIYRYANADFLTSDYISEQE